MTNLSNRPDIVVGRCEPGVNRGCSLEEQLDSIALRDHLGWHISGDGKRQRGDWELVLVPDVQWRPAGRKDLKGRADGEERCDVRRSGEHMLNIVEDEQDLPRS